MMKTLERTLEGCLILAAAAIAAGSCEAQACDDQEYGPWVEMAMARGIENRKPIDQDRPFVAGETVYAWTNVHEYENGVVEHVWKKDGREIARYSIDIGGSRWRTWTRQRVQEGRYAVEVIAAGEVLARREIDVAATTASR
jgi:hypothetical protein